MQAPGGHFSQKTVQKGFDRRFLSFLMGLGGQLSYFKTGCKIVLAHTRKICYDNKNTHKKEKVMSEPRRRLTRYALHGKEEWFKRVFRDQIADPEFEGYCHCMLYYKEK